MRPFTAWMKRVEDKNTRALFLDHVTRDYRESRDLNPQKVISGVGRGFVLLRNARKWSQPAVGTGSPETMEARGRQWRLVMAYGGFEVFAKAHMCHFREQGPPHVSRFVEIAQLSHPAVSGQRYQLPTVRSKSTEALTNAKSFAAEGKGDGTFWHAWLRGEVATVDPVHAVQLARVVRNFSAHGILSPVRAIDLGAVDLCDTLVSTLVTIAGEVIKGSVSGTEV